MATKEDSIAILGLRVHQARHTMSELIKEQQDHPTSENTDGEHCKCVKRLRNVHKILEDIAYHSTLWR